MNDTDTATTQDPAAIEQDIRRTQDDMSRTVDRIGDQLTPKNLFNALLEKADENNIDARFLLEGARRNPIALAMIAGGAIWLVSDSDAKLPKKRAGLSGDGDGADPHHRDYLAHMDRVEWRDDDDAASYQRRRDTARASYLMVERGHDEDEHGFRQRLDEATERFRDKRHAWADRARGAGDSVREKGTNAAGRAREMFSDSPLIGGLLAAAAGAIAGASLPMTRIEEERLAAAGSMARDVLGEQKERLSQAARETKDELVEQASQRVGDGAMAAQGQDWQPQPRSI